MEQAKRYFEIREVRDKLKSELDDAQEKLNEAEQDLIVFMENNSLQNFKDANHGMVYLREQMYARIADEEKAFTWLKANALGDVIKQTVHSKTLAAIAKEQFENGMTEIPGVEAAFETKIGFRKGGANE